MENQSPVSSTSSSSPPKHDQKLKSVVVAEEEKVTMNLLEPKPSQRTILETPSFILEAVRTERDNTTHLCDVCMRGFPSRQALDGHQNSHKKDRELEKQPKLFGPMLSDDTYRGPFDSYGAVSFWPSMYGGGGSSNSSRPYLFSTGEGVKKMKTTMFSPPTLDRYLTGNPSYSTSHALLTDEDINLDLTLGPSKPIGGSSNSIENNTNSLLDGIASKGTTNLISPVRPRVSRFNFVTGNPVDSFTGRYVSPFGNTNLCHDLFSLQGNGMGSSHSKTLFSVGMNSKAFAPPSAPPYPTSTNLCNDLFSSQENSLGSGQSKSLISKGKNKVMVPEDDKDIGIRWLTKKKRSRRGRS